MGLQVTEEDINTLKQRLEKALGDGYEVENHKEVSALMGAVKEIFDLVIFYHGDAICGIDYKNIAYGSLFYDRFQDLYINTISFRHHDRKGPMVSNNGCLMLFIDGFKAASKYRDDIYGFLNS